MKMREIRELYKRIPASKCKDGCDRCCHNIIQFTPSEEAMMGGYRWDGQCPHLKEGKCAVYDNRPLVCRIYGTSELFQCKDCTPERLLSEEETLEIMREYNRIRDFQLKKQREGE
ncbi:MAG: YkgJ family cysteine cluster protein [Eubacteriales bacterium]|jgi:Fe-S-cluster containining protein|nr:hypothetical protein [Clostridiales bacterium]